MSDAHDWQELIDRHLRGELSESEQERLAELLDSDAAARKDFVEQVQWDTRLAEVLRESRGSSREANVEEGADDVLDEQSKRVATVARRWVGDSPRSGDRSYRGNTEPAALRQARTTTFMKALLAISAVIIVALAASLYFRQPSTERPAEETTAQQPSADPPIARISGLSGPLQWTGDGGRVTYDLSAGAELSGGTIEGLAPGSWFELEFNDGSTATISGNSMLTFSDDGQKMLHLKEGNLSSNVKPQSPGKPMLIYTRSAMLEVLGTQFEVEAERASTTLNVSEGKVRVKRFSDGSTVDVPARHRLIAAADRDMLPRPVPHSVSQWKSELSLGPVRTQGKWSPGTDSQEAKLGAIPYTSPQGMTIYTTGFSVSWGDKPPVTLQPASRLRVRGRIASPQKVYFGITVREANGAFAGRFQTIWPADELRSGQDFEVTLHLRAFRLDPSLASLKQELPSDPFHLVVETIWCHTLDKQAGLEIAEVELELIPPAEDELK